MKKRVELALKIIAIILLLCCISAMIWYFYQRHTLKKESLEFLNQYYKYSRFQEFTQKEATDISEEDWQSWEKDARKSLAEFVPENTDLYESLYADMHDELILELEDEKKERIKVKTAVKVISVKSCRVTADTADCAFVTRETFEMYNGSKNKVETEYTYRFERENGEWMITSWGFNTTEI